MHGKKVNTTLKFVYFVPYIYFIPDKFYEYLGSCIISKIIISYFLIN